MPVPIYVTGGAGFLGGTLVTLLRARNRNVIPVGRSSRSLPGYIQVKSYGDLSPPTGAVLVHLAESNNIAQAEGKGSIHVEQVLGVCRALLGKPWGVSFYASSAVVYGDRSDHPCRPDDPLPDAVQFYQQGKLACEAEFLRRGGSVGRFANLIGPGMSGRNVLSDIITQLQADGPLSIADDTPVRDFLHVEDAARGIIAILEAPDEIIRGRVFNFGSGIGTRIGDLVALTLSRAGQGDRRVSVRDPAGRRSSLVLDIAPTTAALGWRPRISLDETISFLIEKSDGKP